MSRIASGLAWLGLAVLGLVSAPTVRADPENRPDFVTVWLFDCGADTAAGCSTIVVERRIEMTPRILDATLRELFRARTSGAFGRFDDLRDTYYSGEFCGQSRSWEECYQGVTMRDGVAVVDLCLEGIRELNGAASYAMAVEYGIRMTALQFPGVKDVQFSLDGVLVTEWDA